MFGANIKELVARKIHKNSSRNKNPFIVLNGALLDTNKYELELFGEEKENGSISYGALEKANKGTLLIDQVSEIPLDIQSKILRVLTDQKFKRVNGSNDVSVDVRLICSSSKDLKKEIEIGNFREDLFHRINVFEINIEPLNQRISDIPLLIKYFSKKISENYKIKELDIDENNNYILNHNWHGNVRELRNLIERIAILQPDTKEKISNIIKESLKNDNFDDQIAEKRMQTLRVGNPLDKNTDIGAINSKEQLNKIEGLVNEGVSDGGKIFQTECELPGNGFWFKPTLFTDVQPSYSIAREEIFGPVLTTLTFRTPQEAVEIANNTEYGLSAGVWTEKGSKILWTADRLQAGVVWANTFNKFDPSSPFGGYKESGFGREGGRQGLLSYLKAES